MRYGKWTLLIASGIGSFFFLRSWFKSPLEQVAEPAVATTAETAAAPAAALDVFQSVILITIDTLRGDHAGFCGNSDIRTPALDRLSKRSVIYPEAYTNLPLTLPAHSAMMTSRFPRELGVELNSRRLGSGFQTAAEILHANGFATAGYPQAVLQFPRGIERGFDIYHNPSATKAKQRQMPSETVPRNPVLLTVQRTGNSDRDRQEVLLKDAIDWLAIRASLNERYFLWMHLFEPHLPYNPPAPYRFIDQIDNRQAVESALELQARILSEPSAKFSDSEHRINRRLYRDDIFWVDTKLEALFRYIETSATPQPFVVVTSDHGESLHDRDPYYGHGYSLSREEVHIPFMIYSGGRATGIVGNRLVQSVDVAPTILGATGIAIPAHFRGINIAGPESGKGRRIPFSVDPLPRLVGALDLSYKVVHDHEADTWHYWNRTIDPDEQHGIPVDSSAPESVLELRQAALDYLAIGPDSGSSTEPSVENDAEFMNMLESLGMSVSRQ